MNFWTPNEDRILREVYPVRGCAAVARLTKRTERGVVIRARRLGIVRKPHWTPEEDQRLREIWAMVLPLSEIADAMERSEAAVYQRAYEIGIPFGCPAGHEWLSNAAARAGVARQTLVWIMNWARLPIHKSITPPRPTRRKVRAGKLGRPVRLQWKFVATDDVDEAMRRWNATETINQAARRHHISRWRLSQRLRAIGISPSGRGRPVRVTEEQLRQAGAIP